MNIDNLHPRTGRYIGEDNEIHNVVERVTGGHRNITTDHASIHAGEGFSYSRRVPNVADGGTVLLEFKTHATRYVHLKLYTSYVSGAGGLLEVIESPTLTTGTTEVTPINRNRISTTLAGSILKTNPTNITGGTVLETIDFGGGGNGANAPSGSRSLDIEFVLKQDTTYLFRVTNNSGATENITLFVFWYEEGAA